MTDNKIKTILTGGLILSVYMLLTVISLFFYKPLTPEVFLEIFFFIAPAFILGYFMCSNIRKQIIKEVEETKED
ncbi:hypothetical protein [Brassicibacter mesophilus]|uniref:hypothetical protein n=1 Tax=Brassicibacter mesophilus TaxID=745119 RepID=UPI003D24E452